MIPAGPTRYAIVLFAVVFFTYVVLLIPLKGSAGFRINIFRLFIDTLISDVLIICSFAVLYHEYGLVFDGEIIFSTALNAIYFSAVTFSTLGFGDFAPAPQARHLAAIEALIGNLHLGVIVAAIFAGLKNTAES